MTSPQPKMAVMINGSENRNMCGLRAPEEGCALKMLLLACRGKGLVRLSMKHGNVTGFGMAFRRSIASNTLAGAFT